MIEKAQLAAKEISGLDLLSASTVTDAVSQLGNLNVTRLLITDQSGKIVYDSIGDGSNLGSFALFPQIVQAIAGNDVFTWHYQDGTMQSAAATPVFSNGTMIGCVYMMESDAEQGILILSLQSNIFMITALLELGLLLFSLIYVIGFQGRLQRIMKSMRIIREGDYSHRVAMGGHDELTFLGKEFNDLTERLQTSENKRRRFVSDASHELKTPLASIKLLSDSILQNDMDPETVREFVGDIGNEADRLNRMSQKLLTLTRIEASESSEPGEIIHMAPTVDRVVRMLSVIANANEITIHLDLSGDAPVLIQEDDLYQITFNLVENGIKYNYPGGSLTIRLSRDEDNAILQVTDTGMGIPQEAQAHVFERFYRVDKARSRKSGGSGLGLSIVRSMVERNNGQIQIASEVGKGTTFTVIFPAFDTEDAPEEEDL